MFRPAEKHALRTCSRAFTPMGKAKGCFMLSGPSLLVPGKVLRSGADLVV